MKAALGAALLCLAGLSAGPALAQQPAPPSGAQPAPPSDAQPVPTSVPAGEAAPAPAAPAPGDASRVGGGLRVRDVELHGFVSEGGFLSTANEYIGASSRGSLKLFEVGLNAQTQLTERLRTGVQLFSRELGDLEDPLRVDWAFLDYEWRAWLGLRAGIIKMPFGLYNEYADIDSARVPILMPQSVYPLRNRGALLSHRGFSLYGTRALGARSGELEYQAWLGTVSIPENSLELIGVSLDRVDARYVTGAQLFWQLPAHNIRVGATVVRASVDFHLVIDPQGVEELIGAGLVPADFDGALRLSQRPVTWYIASAEYQRGDWLFAAEYSRERKHQPSSLPNVVATVDEDRERFYAMGTRRFAPWLELGAYYSVHHAAAGDRAGRGLEAAERPRAFQRDLAATVRLDVNDHWLWKLEGHFIDGAADLLRVPNPDPERYWGLFLLRTTVTF